MLYQRSLEIEERLTAILGLIRKGNYSTPMIAEEIGVSIPTVSRAVTALRQRGHDIQAEKHARGWSYVLRNGRMKTIYANVRTRNRLRDSGAAHGARHA